MSAAASVLRLATLTASVSCFIGAPSSHASEPIAPPARAPRTIQSLRAALETLLAEPSYQRRDAAAWRRLDEGLANPEPNEAPPRPLFARDTGGGFSAFAIFATLLAGGVALAALSLGLRALRARRRRHGDVRHDTHEAPADTLGPSALDDTPDGWAAAARALAGVGRYEAAARALYLCLLALLHAEHLVDYDRALTNGDLVRGLRAASPLRDAFAGVTRTIDAVVYGHKPLAREDYARFDSLCTELARCALDPPREHTP